jgi:hypothetical protein
MRKLKSINNIEKRLELPYHLASDSSFIFGSAVINALNIKEVQYV